MMPTPQSMCARASGHSFLKFALSCPAACCLQAHANLLPARTCPRQQWALRLCRPLLPHPQWSNLPVPWRAVAPPCPTPSCCCRPAGSSRCLTPPSPPPTSQPCADVMAAITPLALPAPCEPRFSFHPSSRLGFHPSQHQRRVLALARGWPSLLQAVSRRERVLVLHTRLAQAPGLWVWGGAAGQAGGPSLRSASH